ncbi:MAG: 16S rRNA (guanine(527)-N(7))-methyltransferase RsmG [Clostridia bacterium]|nr:16S rRNA (guanine(527)-N(7))-methyltransferase RsmG [Clostridia bacterium]
MPAKDNVLAAIKGSLNLEITPATIAMIEAYIKLLQEGNKKLNLTAITEEDEIWRKHVLDSLLLFSVLELKNDVSVIDVGTGAGLPGILLKICCPGIRLTLLEARKKKVDFLQRAVASLGLTGVECIWGRAENLARLANYREQFDLAVARALARLNILVEYCLPFVKTGGCMVAYKGPEGEKELEEAVKAIPVLGGKELGIWQRQLLAETEIRQLIVIKKEKSTPLQYPRRAGTIKKRPLGANRLQ